MVTKSPRTDASRPASRSKSNTRKEKSEKPGPTGKPREQTAEELCNGDILKMTFFRGGCCTDYHLLEFKFFIVVGGAIACMAETLSGAVKEAARLNGILCKVMAHPGWHELEKRKEEKRQQKWDEHKNGGAV
jgi:hypothetical protein